VSSTEKLAVNGRGGWTPASVVAIIKIKKIDGPSPLPVCLIVVVIVVGASSLLDFYFTVSIIIIYNVLRNKK